MPLSWPETRHIYLSPHLDDAVLSCGGMIYQQAARGESVAVITLFAASPTEPERLTALARQLHRRWQASAPAGLDFSDPPAVRRAEDRRALAVLGRSIGVIHYPLPDCIYRADSRTRQELYTSEQGILGPIQAGDPALSDLSVVPPLPDGATLYAPLAIGKHVDHQIVRQAVESWDVPPAAVMFYEDYPYVAQTGALDGALDVVSGWRSRKIRLDDAAVAAKIKAIEEYTSQISTFWVNQKALDEAIRGFVRQRGGERLWFRYAQNARR